MVNIKNNNCIIFRTPTKPQSVRSTFERPLKKQPKIPKKTLLYPQIDRRQKVNQRVSAH